MPRQSISEFSRDRVRGKYSMSGIYNKALFNIILQVEAEI